MIPSTEIPTDAWPTGQLHEARSILADLIHHPAPRVMLAARVVIAHSPDCSEREDASALQRILEAGSSVAAGLPGGAA